MKNQQIFKARAFTIFELLIVIAVLILTAAMLLPYLAKTHSLSSKIGCVNYLKQVGLAYRVWSADNSDKYPMQVSTNQGGSMELALAGDAFSTFQVMSNELASPKILACPSDTNRFYASNFSADFHRTNLSYVVGIDATETNASMFLSGDRNITNGTRLRRGLLELTTNRLTGWTSEIHNRAGNIGLADGSVQQVSTIGLRTALENTGAVTNRLAVP